jgi:DNA-binding MarR family transcriptional regulator
MMTELKVLQAVRLKGRVNPSDLADTIDVDPAETAQTLQAAIDAGLVTEGKTVRLSPEGRIRLEELLAAERSNIEQTVIAGAYDEFRGVNADFKALVSDWQLKDGQPNSHDDEQYDGAVLSRLDDVHARVTPVIATIAGQLPRLAYYSEKLAAALQKVKAGDTAWLTRPIVDSYHTVWFELHEELIVAAGLTREAEAKAGHAQ